MFALNQNVQPGFMTEKPFYSSRAYLSGRSKATNQWKRSLSEFHLVVHKKTRKEIKLLFSS